MRKELLSIASVVLVAAVLVACGGAAPAATPTPLPPPTRAQQLTGLPGEQQVEAGREAFNKYCSRCHSARFSRSVIVEYGTAQKLLDFVRANMPRGNPDALSDQTRYDIISHLLSEQGLLEPGQEVNADTAGSITLR